MDSVVCGLNSLITGSVSPLRVQRLSCLCKTGMAGAKPLALAQSPRYGCNALYYECNALIMAQGLYYRRNALLQAQHLVAGESLYHGWNAQGCNGLITVGQSSQTTGVQKIPNYWCVILALPGATHKILGWNTVITGRDTQIIVWNSVLLMLLITHIVTDV